MGIDDRMKELAIERFHYRRSKDLDITIDGKRVTRDNSEMPAGMPMIYFCDHCGWPMCILDEQFFLTQVPRACSECAVMQERGWLEEAENESQGHGIRAVV